MICRISIAFMLPCAAKYYMMIDLYYQMNMTKSILILPIIYIANRAFLLYDQFLCIYFLLVFVKKYILPHKDSPVLLYSCTCKCRIKHVYPPITAPQAMEIMEKKLRFFFSLFGVSDIILSSLRHVVFNRFSVGNAVSGS